MKKTILIIGGISGSLVNLTAQYGEAENMLKSQGYKTINPLAELNNGTILKESLFEMLKRANGLYIFSNWRQSEIASLIIEAATDLNLKMIFELPVKTKRNAN